MFDKGRASTFTEMKDRDWAPFFAGRREEIAQFEIAHSESRAFATQNMKSGIFRIYQGAPGCGKTSLLQELRRLHPELLFINIREQHLASENLLLKQIRDSAIREQSTHNKTTSAIEAVLEFFRMRESGKALRKEVSRHLLTKSQIVLYADEAQKFGTDERRGLAVLHENELGIPAIVVLAGLSHTSEKLRSVEGLSRLALNAVVNMSSMSDEECADSTLNMLDAFGVVAHTNTSIVCKEIARMSRGWPQHLNRAQVALSIELLETEGDLASVSMTKVEQQSDRYRAMYYSHRLQGSILGQRPELVSVLVQRLKNEQPRDPVAFEDMCAEEIARLGLTDREGFDPRSYAQAMLERGVLSKDETDRYVVAIPSISGWLEKRHPEDVPSGTTTAREKVIDR